MAADTGASSISGASNWSVLIKVVCQEDGGDEWFCKMKSTTTFNTMFKEYHKIKERPDDYYVFIFDGVKLQGLKTPAEIGMDQTYDFDVDEALVIDAMREVVGGGVVN